MKLSQLQELASSDSPTKLEGGVEAGLQTLKDIKATFASAKTVPEIAQWIESADKLQSLTACQRTVVGVVGSTGAGKSSVINAVLDEECLVPTNCMRACTAVITEIAWNVSGNEDEKYRAEIEFIDRNDWAKELRILTDDVAAVADPLGTEEGGNENSTSVAYQKIRAVYPFLKSVEVRKGEFDIQQLTEHPSVKELLGTTLQLASPASEQFMEKLKTFIDSREKTPGRKKEPDVMEYWPLIKVVRVFVRSAILESGLVLVDLPGMQDSNAARSAVASRYIEQCTGLWVVAPIHRAVDDQVAQKLLGDSFKRQLQFDGTYSNITVICSKADDISVTEILKSLSEEAEATQLHARSELLEPSLKKLQETVGEMKEEMRRLDEEIDQCLTEIDGLKPAVDESDDELTVLLPSPLKRPQRGAADEARKRMRLAHDSETEGGDSGSEEELILSDSEPEKELISREAAKQRLRDAEAKLATLRAELKEPKRRLQPQQKDLREVRAEMKQLKSETRNACVKYRNQYSRPVIQRQFAEGIREIDLENAEHDEEGFDPNRSHRDYAEVARKLPVFCVSSKAYQKISGRLADEERVGGFSQLEDTEIPALQRHALGIVQGTRAVTCRRFLNDLGHFLTSLHLQVVLSDQPLKLADDMRDKELRALTEAMAQLKKELTVATDQALGRCRTVVDMEIFRKLAPAARIASDCAIPTVKSWISHKNDGGLAYQTFRAICVRDGAFKGAKGPLDFNTALVEPMAKYLASSWEAAFSKYLPELLDALAESLPAVLRSFRKQMAERPQLRQASSFALVTRQVKLLEESLKDTSELLAILRAGQKEAGRLFVPTVAAAMADAYSHCVEQSGRGCYMRIKELVMQHVERVQHTMFREAASEVEGALRDFLDDLESEADRKVARITMMIDQDYRALLSNQNIFKALSASRGKIRQLLADVDARFDEVLRAPAYPAGAVGPGTGGETAAVDAERGLHPAAGPGQQDPR